MRWSVLQRQIDKAASAQLKAFAQQIRKEGIDPNLLKLSFSRSSGKGGQHVNTTSSKAEVRLPLTPFPEAVQAQLNRLPHYVKADNSLRVTSSAERDQHSNRRDAIRRLQDMLVEGALQDLPGETSANTVRKMQQHARKETAVRKAVKVQRSSTKQARKRVDRNSDY